MKADEVLNQMSDNRYIYIVIRQTDINAKKSLSLTMYSLSHELKHFNEVLSLKNEYHVILFRKLTDERQNIPFGFSNL